MTEEQLLTLLVQFTEASTRLAGCLQSQVAAMQGISARLDASELALFELVKTVRQQQASGVTTNEQ
jgi:hypothetical protein